MYMHTLNIVANAMTTIALNYVDIETSLDIYIRLDEHCPFSEEFNKGV